MYRITDMFRKNIEATECFEECMRQLTYEQKM